MKFKNRDKDRKYNDVLNEKSSNKIEIKIRTDQIQKEEHLHDNFLI